MIKVLRFISIALLALFVACESNLPVENIEQPRQAVKEPADTKTIPYDQLKVMDFGTKVLEKTTIVYQWIYKSFGGEIINQHFGNDGLYVYNSLYIYPHSIPNSMWLGVQINDSDFQGAVDVQYGPHGLVFSQPAVMNLFAAGLDLSNLNPDNIDIYYDNTEEGYWEEMPCDAVIVDVAAGTIQVINARIPHFSRYAIGTEY